MRENRMFDSLIVCEIVKEKRIGHTFQINLSLIYTEKYIWDSRGTFIFECASISIPTTKKICGKFDAQN